MKLTIKNLETGTSPCVIHGNGAAKKPSLPWYGPWLDVESVHRQYNGFKNEPLRDDLTIMTWKGGKYMGKKTPVEVSCEKFGVSLVILPWLDNPPRGIIPFWYESMISKMKFTVEKFDSGDIKTKYVMLLDIGDVYLFKHPNEILDLYLKHFPQYSSVWNTEKNDWPHDRLPKYVHHPLIDQPIKDISEFDQIQKKVQNSQFVHLNAGAVIGLTPEIHKLYKYAWNTFTGVPTNDQACMKIARHRHLNEHTLDYQCKIFQTLYNVSRDQFLCKIE